MPIIHRDIILSVLFLLEADKKAVDLETLTACCFRTFPSKFSMDRFPEYPRFDKVEKRMSEIEFDGLVNKDETMHYKLTDKGVQWVKDNSEVIEIIKKEGLSFEQVMNYNIGDREYEIEAKKLKKSEAYKKYIEGDKEKISIIDFMNFLKVDIYAKKELFDRKTMRIRSICLRDKELGDIFGYLENKYGINYGIFGKEIQKVSSSKKKEVKDE